MNFCTLLFTLGVAATCRQRKDIHQDSTAYIAALKQLNGTQWYQLTAKLNDTSFNVDRVLVSSRLFLHDVETALQAIDSDVTIPYWECQPNDAVFLPSQFGVSPTPRECANSTPLSGFTKADGTCLKHVQPAFAGAFYNHIESIPKSVPNGVAKFSKAQRALLLHLAETIFQTNNLLTAVQDPLFLSVLARMDASWQSFLDKRNFRTKAHPSNAKQLKWKSSLLIAPWDLTTAEVLESHDSSCVTYKF